jgi:hypothetical protein
MLARKFTPLALAAAAVAAIVASGAVLAQAGGKISRNVSKESRLKLDRAADRAAAEDDASQTKLLRSYVDRVQRELQSERAALEAQLKKQPEYSAYKKALDALVKKSPGKSLSAREAQEQAKALSALHGKYAAMYRSAYKAAKIDDARVLSVLTKHAPARAKLKKLSDGVYVLHHHYQDEKPAPKTAFCFKQPYDTAATSKTSDGVVLINTASATASNGRFDLAGWAHFGGLGRNRGVVGSYFQVPAGFTRVKVTAKVQVNHRFYTMSMPGIGSAGGDVAIELTGTQTQRQTKSLGTVISPLLWYASNEGNEEHLVTRTFTIPANGGDYLVRAGARTTFACVGNAFGEAFVNGDVYEICVQLQP